jgi:hypothetical protein
MAKRYDIGIDGNNDAIISADLDFVFQASDQQHIQDTLNAWPGWWKEYPLDGVAIESYVKSSSGMQLLARKIKVELNSDQYQVNNPIIGLTPDGTLKINPNADRV